MVPLSTIRLAVLEVACARCQRRVRYRVATLIGRHSDISEKCLAQ